MSQQKYRDLPVKRSTRDGAAKTASYGGHNPNLFTFVQMNYFILAGGWFFYFVVHSVLAADGVKGFASKTLGSTFRFYRLFYSIVSSLGLIALLVVNGSIQSGNFFDPSGLIRYLSLMLTTFGVMTIQLSFRQYRLKSFLGFAEEKTDFRIEGILKYIRHPIYSGLILVTIGFFLFIPNLPTLISCLSIFIYLPIGIFLEEKKLDAAFGEMYRQYRLDVPALIPRFPLQK